MRDRGVYLNIGAPVPGITVHDWSDARWETYLDRIRRAGATTLHFHVWQDVLSDFACAPERRADNRRLHERLQTMIRRARRRGLRTVFLMAPTFVPRPIFDAHPRLHAEIEYVDHGFPCLCPSRDATWPLIEAFLTHEWNWFRECDAYQLWFYDPGGCVCDRCRADLCAPLLRQIDLAERVVRRASPRARVEISLWPVWAWERILKRPFGEELLDRVAARRERARPVVVDSAEGDDAFLEEAKARGFQAHGFQFSANVETPFVFFHPLTRYFEETTTRLRAKRVDGALVHALNPAPKELSTLIGLRTLTRPDDPTSRRIRDACRIHLGDRAAADRLAPHLERWESLLGAPKPDPGAATDLARDVDIALGALRSAEADAVRTSIRAVAEILAPDTQTLPERLTKLLGASAMFRAFAPVAAAEHAALRTFVDTGWNSVHY
ncbi:MAG: hypothetical protein ACKO5K_13430 [Armatimonadota bacterium]